VVSVFQTNTYMSIPGEYGKNLTPRGSAVNVTHTSVSRLVLLDSLEGDSAQQLIQKVHRTLNSIVQLWSLVRTSLKVRNLNIFEYVIDLVFLHSLPKCIK
jgi:hypothetical protein